MHEPQSSGELYDPIRRRRVVATPEEYVRQQLLSWLTKEWLVPAGLIAVEKAIDVHGAQRRPDIVVHDRTGRPWMVIECKAPDVNLTQAAADQVAVYNRVLRAPYLLVTNGRVHLGFELDHNTGAVATLSELPPYT